MHRCWLIPELSTQILTLYAGANLRESDDSLDLQVRRTLAMLARTSRALHGPALDLLWYRMESMVPLLKLLPPELWRMHRSTSVPRGKLVSVRERYRALEGAVSH